MAGSAPSPAAGPSDASRVLRATIDDALSKALASHHNELSVEIAALQAGDGENLARLQGIDAQLAEDGPILPRLRVIETQQAMILARLEALSVLGSDTAPSGGGTKRPPRATRVLGTPSTASSGAAASGTAATSAALAEDLGKVANAMLYCRRAFASDPSFRERWGQMPGVQEQFQTHEVITRYPPDTSERWQAEGRFLWSNILTEEQKKQVRLEFATWKEEQERNTVRAPLGDDSS
jgi:hypothetical protein